MEKQRSDKVAMELVAAAHFEGARLSVKTICAVAGIGKTKLYEEFKAGRLAPIAGLGAHCTCVRSAEVKAFLDGNKEAA